MFSEHQTCSKHLFEQSGASNCPLSRRGGATAPGARDPPPITPARDARPAAAAWRAAGGAAAVAGGGPGAEGSPYFLDTSRSGVIL